MSDSSLVCGVLHLMLQKYQNSQRYMAGAGDLKASEGLGSFQPLASPTHPTGSAHLLVHLELLLTVTEHVLDEILQFPRQLQVAERQLVRGDTEDLPEWSEGPGDGQCHTQGPPSPSPCFPLDSMTDIGSGTYCVLSPAKHQHILTHLIPTATVKGRPVTDGKTEA